MECLAEHWGERNAILAIREGNTRAQFVFFFEVTYNAGYRLNTRRFPRDERPPRRPSESSIEWLPQPVGDQRTRHREQFRAGGFAADHDGS